jgi:hypothetical protein
MTPEEHKLIVMMLCVQEQQIKILLDLLKNKEIISEDDLQAFAFAARIDTPSNAAIQHLVADRYRELATRLGIQLPTPPARPPSERK